MHFNLVRKGLVKRPQDWPWPRHSNFALGKEEITRCRMQIDYVRLPEAYGG
jgi:hypothetical protein